MLIVKLPQTSDSQLHTSMQQIACTKQHSALLCWHCYFITKVLNLAKFAFDGDYDFIPKVILHCLVESLIFCHSSVSRFPTFAFRDPVNYRCQKMLHSIHLSSCVLVKLFINHTEIDCNLRRLGKRQMAFRPVTQMSELLLCNLQVQDYDWVGKA